VYPFSQMQDKSHEFTKKLTQGSSAFLSLFVMPDGRVSGQALRRHSRGGGNPGLRHLPWMPAFAGMTRSGDVQVQ